MDCTDKDLLEDVTQCALQRGKRALEKAAYAVQPTPSGISTRASFYYGRSSCDSLNSSESTSNEASATILQKPQQMMQQAAEVSSNKGPVLTLKPHYILKPLSLSHMYDNDLKDSLKGSKKDKTKLYRGVREIAFYETLTNAPNLSTMFILNNDKSFRSKWYAMRFINKLRSNAMSFPDTCISIHEGIWFLFHMFKDLCTSKDAWNRLVFLLAHYSGDKVVISAFRSYIGACMSLANTMDSLNKMAVFTPDYFGLVDLKSIDTHEHSTLTTNKAPSLHYLLLEDITINYRHPNVIDLKMGTQTYEPSAPDSKKMREVQKYTMQEEFGFRIEGMRFYDESTNGYICQGKRFGTGLMTEVQVIYALRMFLCSGTDTICSSTVDSIMRQLIEIKHWFQNCNSDIAIYTGSILIVHEGSIASKDEAAPPAVKMIDYEHVCRRKGGDEGYLKGINTLLSMLNEIRGTVH